MRGGARAGRLAGLWVTSAIGSEDLSALFIFGCCVGTEQKSSQNPDVAPKSDDGVPHVFSVLHATVVPELFVMVQEGLVEPAPRAVVNDVREDDSGGIVRHFGGLNFWVWCC